MYVPCTCNVHHKSTFLQYRDIPVVLYQYDVFSVPSSKTHKLRGSHVHKVLPHWHVLLLALVKVGGKRFDSYMSTRLACSLKKDKEVQILCTCAVRAIYTPGKLLYSIVIPLSSSATLPSLVSVAKKIEKLEGSHVKKFSLSGTCYLCR